jgi:outer membrane receptor protein involved in Fe transport
MALEAFSTPVLAQDGKLAGTVTDTESGEPLPGVNVVLQGTQLGAATKSDGSYTIIGINPGSYDVRLSLVGYGTKVVQDVRITSDRTRTLNVEMSSEVVQGEEVVVQAVEPVVDADQTASRTTFTGAEMEQLPAANIEDVLGTTAKSYDGVVRGSRRFSTKTVLEGIDISNEFNKANSITGGSNTRLGYGSTVRNDEVKDVNSLFNLGAGPVSEASISTGATPASTPSGSGGVVSIALQEGRGEWGGSASVRTAPSINTPGPDSLSFYPEEEVEAWFAEEESIRESGDSLLASLYTWERGAYDIAEDPEVTADFTVSGGVTENFGLTVAGQFHQTEGYRPNSFNRRLNAQVKATYNVTPNTKLTAIGLFKDEGLWGGWNNRNYSNLWKYYLQGTAQDDGGSYVGSVKGRHVLGEDSYIEAQYYRKYARTRYGYPDDNNNGFVEIGEDGEFINFLETENIAKYNWIQQGPPEEKMFYGGPFPPGRSDNVTQPRGEPYRAAGPMPYYEDSKRTTNSFKVDYSNQLTPHHLVRVGTQAKFFNFDYTETRSELFEFGFTLNNDLNNDGDDVQDIEPFAPSTFERSPWELSLYVSDRIEYGNLIVNAGLRTEFVDRDMRKIEDHFFPFRRDTVMVDGRTVARNFFDRGDKVPVDIFWEPRVGVSHPISETAAVYFSYSRSQDLPPYGVMYDFYDGNHSANQFLTYQHADQEPTTSNDYEFGAQWEFLEGWGLDVNAYARSVDNYGRQNMVAVNRVPEGEDPLQQSLSFNRHVYETSAGYADIRGIEVEVQRRLFTFSGEWGLGVTGSYTFSTIETANILGGANKNRFRAEEVEGTRLPFDNINNFRNFPQEVQGGASTITGGFNRRHRGLLRAIFQAPFNIRLGIDSRIESGFLYRKVVNTDPRDRGLASGPTNYRIDLRLQKEFADLIGDYGVSLYLDVKNLTDRNNILAFNQRAPNGGQRFQEEGDPGNLLVLPDGSSVYGPARNFHFGARVQF